jgi:thiamine-phosphate pyrophosphorylase
MSQPSPSSPLLRILDANANRVLEGLRVVEEYPRFVLNSAELAEDFKRIRHELSALLQEIPRADRLMARDTEQDVGTEITLARESSRNDLESVVAANFQRIFEAMRVLEEYGKVGWPRLAATVEALRYRLYALEKRLASARPIHSRSQSILASAQLYVLIDGGRDERDFADRVGQLVAAKVPVLQLRAKHLSDRVLLERACQLRAQTAQSETLAIVNDRPDVARLSQADGVHVGQDEIPPEEVRAIVGPLGIVGLSTHSPEQVQQAVRSGVDYIGCGPTFASRTKEFGHFPGLDFLRQIAGELELPAFAIGGISEDNLDQVLAAGMRRVAVQQAVWGDPEPAVAARRILRKLKAARG